ncbi:MAG: hypothetical protein HC769_35115 [Cyanobacteria bacterium CRU_2_1]|nr:hypothetical protein [Cyanobacteria bacterium RU_5_0]NJR63556.1 hypothetical protein [Cyanobacteria bacterium CRU_2_1]
MTVCNAEPLYDFDSSRPLVVQFFHLQLSAITDFIGCVSGSVTHCPIQFVEGDRSRTYLRQFLGLK